MLQAMDRGDRGKEESGEEEGGFRSMMKRFHSMITSPSPHVLSSIRAAMSGSDIGCNPFRLREDIARTPSQPATGTTPASVNFSLLSSGQALSFSAFLSYPSQTHAPSVPLSPHSLSTHLPASLSSLTLPLFRSQIWLGQSHRKSRSSGRGCSGSVSPIVIRFRHAMCGPDLGYAAPRKLNRRYDWSPRAVWVCKVGSASMLRACFAKPGTDGAYGAAQDGIYITDPVVPYARAMRCPVLT
eukprot:1980560-Rhodomonas_salina.1